MRVGASTVLRRSLGATGTSSSSSGGSLSSRFFSGSQRGRSSGPLKWRPAASGASAGWARAGGVENQRAGGASPAAKFFSSSASVSADPEAADGAAEEEFDPDDAYAAQLDASGESTVGGKHGMNEGMGTNPAQKFATLQGLHRLDLGGVLEEVTVAYEEWGPKDGPVIVVLPSFSMGSHARSSPENPARGWWEPMIGPGKSIDTNKYRVICASSLGAPFGTTCPLSVNPATPGMSYGGKFPQITPHDMSSVHARLLREHLGLKKVFAVVGGSLGGMLALHLIVDYPGFAEKCVSLAATGRSTPGTVALRSAQRSLLEADPAYRGGDYDPKDPPKEGMKQARKLGMMFYRSRQEFDDKFGWKADKDHKFEVEAYLQKAGDTFAGKFDPNCWMLLSRGMDLMDVGRPYQDSFDRALKRVRSDCLFVAFTHDRLIPAHEMRDVVEKLRANEEKEQMIEFHEHPSIYGHDAFLKEFKWMNEHMSVFFGDKAEVDPANLQ